MTPDVTVVTVAIDVALSSKEVAVAVDEGISPERYAQLKLFAMADGIDPAAVKHSEGYLRFIQPK